MTARLTAWTSIGAVRAQNEDCIALPGVVVGDAPPSPVYMAMASRPVGSVFAVIDGMGGHAAGRYASHLAAAAVAARQDLDPASLIAEINRSMYDAMAEDPELTAMGATIVCCRVTADGVTVANAGDARCYLHASGYASLISIDDRHRENGTITQSLGGMSRPTSVEPHVSEVSLEPGDRLLLCSDGLWDVVPFGDIQQILDDLDPYRASVELVRQALVAGAPDNVSVLIYTDEGEPTS